MDDKKFNLLVDRLLERTKEGKVNWESTSKPNVFLTGFSDSSISIKRYTPKEQMYEEFFKGISKPVSKDVNFITEYEFDFRDENGDAVESFQVVKENKEMFEKAKELYELAKNQTQKSHPIVDSILEQLAA